MLKIYDNLQYTVSLVNSTGMALYKSYYIIILNLFSYILKQILDIATIIS